MLVLGFSGADLTHGDDYLGLRAAADRTPWLGWNVRPDAAPLPRAAEILAACGIRGHVLSGDLPGLLASLGIRLVEVVGAESNAQRRLGDAVERWTTEVDGDFCGVALARLLDLAGLPFGCAGAEELATHGAQDETCGGASISAGPRMRRWSSGSSGSTVKTVPEQ